MITARRHKLVMLLALACRLEHSTCAVPPLSQDSRQDMASIIMIGRVGATTVKLMDKKRDGDFVDAIHTAHFEIIKIEKGSGVSTISWWVPHHRPPAWTGHQGQTEHPPTSEMVRVFATAAGELLAPNGWELYKDESELMPESEPPGELESPTDLEPPKIEEESSDSVPPPIEDEADASVIDNEEELEVIEEEIEDEEPHAIPDPELPPLTETHALQRSYARPLRVLFRQFARLKQAIRNLFRRKFRGSAGDTEL